MNNNYYITTPLYYINAKPHIGHAYTSIITDIFARFAKIENKNVYFTTGTDEYGQKIQKSAKEKNMQPLEYANKMREQFKDLAKILNCSFTDFISTTETRHHIAAQHFWNILLKKEYIYLDKYKGWYSVREEAFYQADELKDGTLPSGEKLEWVEEDAYFFTLSKMQDRLLDFYNKNPEFIYPKTRANEVINFVKSGLKDLCVSRTAFSWGVQVPNNKKHVIYVWLEALSNYLTSIGYPSEHYAKIWNNESTIIHVIGKDILRFHAVYWPAFLIAAEIPNPTNIIAHGWWTNKGEKISKSLNNTIDPIELINQYGLENLRYFLIKGTSLKNDGDFNQEIFTKTINTDLNNNIGNLINRTLSLIYKNCNKKTPDNTHLTKTDRQVIKQNIQKANLVRKYFKEFEIDKALIEILSISSESNKYLNDQQPWNIKDDIDRKNAILYTSLESIKTITILLSSFIPHSCQKVFDILNMDNITIENIETPIEPGKEINEPYIIFNKI